MTTTLHVVTPGYPHDHMLCPCKSCRETARVIIAARANATPHAYNPRCYCNDCTRRLTVNLAERRQQARRNERLEEQQPWHPRRSKQLRAA